MSTKLSILNFPGLIKAKNSAIESLLHRQNFSPQLENNKMSVLNIWKYLGFTSSGCFIGSFTDHVRKCACSLELPYNFISGMTWVHLPISVEKYESLLFVALTTFLSLSLVSLTAFWTFSSTCIFQHSNIIRVLCFTKPRVNESITNLLSPPAQPTF